MINVHSTIETVDHGKAALKLKLVRLRKMKALVGIPSSAESPADDQGRPLGITMAELGYVHEKGSPAKRIPSRPFMYKTRERVQGKYAQYMGHLYQQVVHGKLTPDEALKKVGARYEGDMKKSFTVEYFVPDKPATVAQKHSSRPLIDTGALRQSITSKVEG